MRVIRKVGSKRFKLVPEPAPVVPVAPKAEPPAADAEAKAPKTRGRATSVLGFLTGVSVHTAMIGKLFGPVAEKLKGHGKELLLEVFKGAEVLGARFFPKASTRRLGPVSAAGVLVLLIGFGPCIFFTTRAVLRVVNLVENYKERSTRDLAAARKARETAKAPAAAPVNDPSTSSENKP